MREVDPRAEQALAGVARVIDHAAAQHADVATLIEQRDVDRRLERHERRFVLGVEEARVLHRHDRRLALALDAGAAEVERARALELRKPRRRSRQRQQRGVAKMRAGERIGEHGGQEKPLGDFQALLVLLQARRLGGELGVARQQAGKLCRGAAA